MKHLRKVMALVLATFVALVVAVPAFAATITINRDEKWDPNAENAAATYTYYKIFDATITTAAGVDVETGELEDTDGNVVYTISGTDAAAKVAVLPDIFTAKLAADGKYYITLTDETTGAADIVAALKTMVDANTTLFPGVSTTSDEDPVEITVGDDGYYLITASNGKNLAVQTIGDVVINEKNDYPSISKKQKKEADPTYTEAEIPAEIGTYHDYEITVSVPSDANKPIYVIDKMTDGLEYDATTGLTLDPDVAYSAIPTDNDAYDADAVWQIMFDEATVIANQGEDIVITYRALITEDCLVDTGRENEVTLKYDEGNYVLKDKTNYTTYFGGIEKIDGKTEEPLEGVVFSLTADGTAFNVKKVGDYYIPDPEGSSNEVVTDADGKIIIRGLDEERTYTLTEEDNPNPGYNLLDEPKDLVLVEDTGDAYTTTTFDQVINNKGTQLPSTGGMGTTILYTIGGIMLVGGAIALVSKKRVANMEK